MHAERLRLVRQQHAGALLVTHLPHICWLSGFTGSNATIYLDAKHAFLITDARYLSQAESQAPDFQLQIARHAHLALADLGEQLESTIGFDPDVISVTMLNNLQITLPNQVFTPVSQVFSRLMAVKTPTELDLLQKAQAITDKVFTQLLDVIKPGLSEKTIAAEIVYRQIRAGADGIPAEFWPIVASGPNSALPHAAAGDRIIQDGDTVLLDFGCQVGGYASDMSRTVVVGKATAKFKKVYALVLEAQTAAIDAAKAGISGHDLDAIARNILAAEEYEMPHALGHGVGLELHEWPRVGRDSHDALPNGAAITIEPGVYLPGKFGIRIEDMVVLTPKGCSNLTESPKQLIEIPVN